MSELSARTRSRILSQHNVGANGAEDLAVSAPSTQEWHDLLHWSTKQRVPGLLAEYARSSLLLADRQQRELDAAVLRSIARCVVIDSVAASVADVLDERGIEWRLLKGVATSVLLYQRSSERSYVDVDILVRPRDLAAALEALAPVLRAGASVQAGPLRDSSLKERALLSCEGVEIDVHQAIQGCVVTSTVPVETFFEAPQVLNISGREMLAPNSEALFVHAVLHSTSGGTRASSLPDVALLAQRCDPQHPRFEALLSEPMARDLFAWSLLRATKAVSVPGQWVSFAIRHKPSGRRARWFEWIQGSEARVALAARTSGDNRLRRIAETLWPTREFLKQEELTRLGSLRRLWRRLNELPENERGASRLDPEEPVSRSGRGRRTLIIIQPYVPRYRQPLFEALHARLAEQGVDLRVLAGRPDREQAKRNDAVRLPFQMGVRSWSLHIRDRSIRWKSVFWATRKADLIVCELASGALENHVLALVRPGRLAVWGHGYAATSRSNRLDAALEHRLMRRARRVFAYTERGRVEAVQAGARPERITVLQNTVDTTELCEHIANIVDAEVQTYAKSCGLDTRYACVSIGGLDSSKRLEFLLEAAAIVAGRLPQFRLAICGDGVDRDLVKVAALRFPWLVYLGRADERDKALLARSGQLLLNPGRVGLISVESLVMGLPIVTTRWDHHAPEVDYLEDGRTAVFAENTTEAFAEAVIELLTDNQRLSLMREACLGSAEEYSMVQMVGRFADGIMVALSKG